MLKLRIINKPKMYKLKCNFAFPNIILANMQEKEVTPTKEIQEVVPDIQYDGLSKVTVEAVTNEIDSNIQPNNIKLGVNILGVDGNLEPDKPDQTKTITPTKETQTIKPDTGYELAEVTVNPIPDEYIKPSGTLDISSNGTYDVKSYESANVNVGSFVIDNYGHLFENGARLNVLNDLLPLCKGATIAYYMFASCYGYTGTLDLSSLDVSKIYRLDNMFNGLGRNNNNVQLKLPEIKTNLSCDNMFQGFGGDVLDISPMVNGQSFSKNYMFWNAKFTKLIINKPYVFPLNSNDLKGTTIEKATGYVYVPDDMVDTYKSATNWSVYASQIKGMSELV